MPDEPAIRAAPRPGDNSFGNLGERPYDEQLSFVVETMRELSSQADPEVMVRAYSQRMRQIMPSDGFMSLSRRGLTKPQYRITRSSLFTERINPWTQSDILPLLEGGLISDLIYGNEPVVINDLKISPGDPAAKYLAGHGSLVAIPLFDEGESLNMVIQLRNRRNGYDPQGLPQHVWMANLFGRATTNLVLSNKLREAYEVLDRELKAVGEIQKSLLPAELPDVPGLDIAAYYQTSTRAGGDYYDFFPLPDGQWGILVADVSGHGTPAAVLMAITHSIAHTCGDPKHPASNLLSFVNDRLAAAYTNGTGNFVTAFYGIWDPRARKLSYASAGHPQPRIRRADGRIEALEGEHGLPLGILREEIFPDNHVALEPSDAIVLYTDGITEARGPRGDMYETERLDASIKPCDRSAAHMLECILTELDSFIDGRPAGDDRTILVVKVR